MSHVLTGKTKVHDAAVLIECLTKNPDVLWHKRGEFKLYGTTVKGYGFQIKGWKYPIVVNFETGEIRYDNYGGSWGDQKQLDHLMQSYGVAVTRQEALHEGRHIMQQEVLADGSVKIVLGGGGSW